MRVHAKDMGKKNLMEVNRRTALQARGRKWKLVGMTLS